MGWGRRRGLSSYSLAILGGIRVVLGGGTLETVFGGILVCLCAGLSGNVLLMCELK